MIMTKLHMAILGYSVIHLLCVNYMFFLFDYEHYVADDLDKWLVWLFAPLILFIIMTGILGGMKK